MPMLYQLLTSSVHVQEEMTGDVMSEDSREVTRGLQGVAQPAPKRDIAEAESAAKEEKKMAKKDKKKKAIKAVGRKSVKELLSDMGVRVQKQTDPDFTGICPHCKGKGETFG